MKTAKYEDLFHEGLGKLYDAEKQIVAALPKMIAASSSIDLSGAFDAHLEDTKQQVARLETIFERMGEQPGSGECRVMQALLDEGERLIADYEKSPELDAALIAAAQKVEHFEIAAYRSMCAIAELLGQEELFDLLETTLAEEMEADETLTEAAESIMGGDTEEPEEAA